MIENLEVKKLLESSNQFQKELIGYMRTFDFSNSPRNQMALYTSDIVYEHSRSICHLISQELFLTSMSVLRLQFDVLIRQWWIFFVAANSQIEKLATPLTRENFTIMNNPVISTEEMLDDLDKKAQVGLHARLVQSRNDSAKVLSSFVHTGVHPYEWIKAGIPVNVILNVLKQSNYQLHMAYSILAVMENNNDLYNVTQFFAKKYQDCLFIEVSE